MSFATIPSRTNAREILVAWFDALKTAGMNLETFLGGGFVVETSVSLVNGQASPLAITGMSFSSASYSSVKIDIEINQKTASAELITTGKILLFWRALTSTWDIFPEFEGDDAGVDFTVATVGAVGSVKYTLGTLSGATYVGKIKFKAMTFGV